MVNYMLTPLEFEDTPSKRFNVPHRAISRILRRYILTLLESNADLPNATTSPSKNTTTPSLSSTQHSRVLSFSSPATLLTFTAPLATPSFCSDPTFHQPPHLTTSTSSSSQFLSREGNPFYLILATFETYATVTRPAAKQKNLV